MLNLGSLFYWALYFFSWLYLADKEMIIPKYCIKFHNVLGSVLRHFLPLRLLLGTCLEGHDLSFQEGNISGIVIDHQNTVISSTS